MNYPALNSMSLQIISINDLNDLREWLVDSHCPQFNFHMTYNLIIIYYNEIIKLKIYAIYERRQMI